ncbi:hypothetical protein BACOV975_03200 [Bacteroides ovatus V975]|nr:hypothetical protein BACOV975_03200 [Bacteroides ovatus V975]
MRDIHVININARKQEIDSFPSVLVQILYKIIVNHN